MGNQVLYGELYHTIQADDVDSVIWNDVPKGSTFTYKDKVWVVNDGVFTFATKEGGIYILDAAFPEPYRPLRFEITAISLPVEETDADLAQQILPFK